MKLHSQITLLVMVLLALMELWYSWREHKHLFKAKETRKSLIIAAGALASNFSGKAITFFVLEFVYQFRFFTLCSNWWIWVLAFLASDFSFYWFHRAQHHINWFWASHAVHHSSSDFNLLASLRGPWFTSDLSGKVIFWSWTSLLGFSPLMMTIVYEIIKNYQFWIHTEAIKKLHPLFEFVFNTPSHHRVHHGSNLKYLDKNNGGVFIIWDRLFGSFQEEEERPEYGLTKKTTQLYSPVRLVFGQWQSLLMNVVSSNSLRNGINYIIQPPGWSHDGSSKTAGQMRDTKRN